MSVQEILAVAIRSSGDVLEPIIIQLSQEAGVPLVSKVLGENLRLKDNWHMNFESSAMRHPRDPLFILWIREDMVNLLREAHVFDIFRVLIINFRLNLGKVSVGMIHGSARSCWTKRNVRQAKVSKMAENIDRPSSSRLGPPTPESL